ncbi:MAG: hypothetical protein KAH25_03005 [Bacteroidales bacterium]|nr:hypothetical protein [Bacteroidales bacterium]
MKKWTAILLLLIANSILLVHAAIPHHLHEGVFCEINTSCETECADHKTHQHHEHQGESHDLDCELDTVVVLPSSVFNKNIVAVELELFSNHHISFVVHHVILKPYLIYQRQYIPQKLSLYLLSLSSIQGFRAPPVFV